MQFEKVEKFPIRVWRLLSSIEHVGGDRGFSKLINLFVFVCFYEDQSLRSLLDHLRINSSTDVGSMIISEAGQGNVEQLKDLFRAHPDKVSYCINLNYVSKALESRLSYDA